MAVEVNRSQRKDEDPLDKLMKITSIGTSVAGMASKSGAMDRRLDSLKTGDPTVVSDTSNMGKLKSKNYGSYA